MKAGNETNPATSVCFYPCASADFLRTRIEAHGSEDTVDRTQVFVRALP